MAIASVVERLGTSLRVRPAAKTAEVATRLLAQLGVTQVLDVTPLDHLGLPVFLSVRPKGKIAQVHSGKGMHADDARAGALMEAVEFAACETASAAAVVQRKTISALQRQWPIGLSLVDFAPRLGVSYPLRAPLAAVTCELLQTRRSLLVPAELALMPEPRQRTPRLFGSSSNGLASGNTLDEATLHALLEVIERDTVALQVARDDSRSLVASTLPPPFDAMSRAWRRRGIRLYVRYLPNAMELPCFEAAFHEPAATLGAMVLTRGWGLHFDREIALSRAICEAAQSRLAVVVANRPEMPGAKYLVERLGEPQAPETTARQLARLTDTGRRTRLDAVPHETTPSIGEALRSVLARLPFAGMGPVFRKRLHLDGNPRSLRGLHVVKVVVARSETPVGDHPRIGPRLLARLQAA